MSILWDDKAFEDFFNWMQTDRKTAVKIYKLVQDIQRNGIAQGIGKPEALRYRKEWSRRIDEKNRLVYTQDEDGTLLIRACKGHYDD